MAPSDQSSCRGSHMRRAAGHGTATEPGQTRNALIQRLPWDAPALSHLGSTKVTQARAPAAQLAPWFCADSGFERKTCLMVRETPWQGTATEPGEVNPWHTQDFQLAGIS